MKLNLLNDTEQINVIIRHLLETTYKLLSKQSKVVIAVSGGKSPIPLFQKLSTQDLPWEQITFTLVDERITAPASVDSNENLVKNYLLKNKASSVNFISLVNDPTQSHQLILSNANKMVNQIDIAILGMGEDGHTASIFPDCAEFEAAIDLNQPPSYIITTPRSAKYTRVGLNLSALTTIKHLILSISGSTKHMVLKEAMQAPNNNYPISYLFSLRKNIHIFSS